MNVHRGSKQPQSGARSRAGIASRSSRLITLRHAHTNTHARARVRPSQSVPDALAHCRQSGSPLPLASSREGWPSSKPTLNRNSHQHCTAGARQAEGIEQVNAGGVAAERPVAYAEGRTQRPSKPQLVISLEAPPTTLESNAAQHLAAVGVKVRAQHARKNCLWRAQIYSSLLPRPRS